MAESEVNPITITGMTTGHPLLVTFKDGRVGTEFVVETIYGSGWRWTAGTLVTCLTKGNWEGIRLFGDMASAHIKVSGRLAVVDVVSNYDTEPQRPLVYLLADTIHFLSEWEKLQLRRWPGDTI